MLWRLPRTCRQQRDFVDSTTSLCAVTWLLWEYLKAPPIWYQKCWKMTWRILFLVWGMLRTLEVIQQGKWTLWHHRWFGGLDVLGLDSAWLFLGLWGCVWGLRQKELWRLDVCQSQQVLKTLKSTRWRSKPRSGKKEKIIWPEQLHYTNFNNLQSMGLQYMK